jgi:hypothetical protein
MVKVEVTKELKYKDTYITIIIFNEKKAKPTKKKSHTILKKELNKSKESHFVDCCFKTCEKTKR